MSDTNDSDTPVASDFREPATNPATEDQVSNDHPPVATGSEPEPQETGKADQAFAEFQAQTPDEDSTSEAPASTEPAKNDSEPKKAPQDKPASEPQASEPELEPTESETKDGRVSVKKLTRALRSRGELKEKFEATEKARIQTETALNSVLDQMADTELEPSEFKQLLTVIAPARKGDAKARKAAADLLGIDLTPPAPQFSSEDLQTALRMAAEEMDPEAGMKFLAGKRNPAQPVAQAAPPIAQPLPTEQPAQRQAKPAETYTKAHLDAEMAGIGAVMVSAFPVLEQRNKVVSQIEQEVASRLNELNSLGVEVSHKVVAATYRKAQATVLAKINSPVVAPKIARSVRSSSNQAPLPKQTADERFRDWQTS